MAESGDADDADVVQMTDSALAYNAYCPPGVVQRHYVNHQEKEYSRSVDMLGNTETGENIPGMAGTQFLDHEWRLLKASLPETGDSAH